MSKTNQNKEIRKSNLNNFKVNDIVGSYFSFDDGRIVLETEAYELYDKKLYPFLVGFVIEEFENTFKIIAGTMTKDNLICDIDVYTCYKDSKLKYWFKLNSFKTNPLFSHENIERLKEILNTQHNLNTLNYFNNTYLK